MYTAQPEQTSACDAETARHRYKKVQRPVAKVVFLWSKMFRAHAPVYER